MTASQPAVQQQPPTAAPALDRAVIVTGLVVICGQIMAILDTSAPSVN